MEEKDKVTKETEKDIQKLKETELGTVIIPDEAEDLDNLFDSLFNKEETHKAAPKSKSGKDFHYEAVDIKEKVNTPKGGKAAKEASANISKKDTSKPDIDNATVANIQKSEQEQKAKPGVKKKTSSSIDKEEAQKPDEKLIKKQKKQQAKKNKAALAAKAKANSLKKKRIESNKKQEAKKKAKLIQDEEAKNEPKLNKLGVIFILSIFIIIGGTVIIGTNSFSYSNAIQEAAVKLNEKKYNDAYDTISGVNVKKEDKKTKDQIYTIMFVKKQIDSYEAYMGLDKPVNALDALIKGVNRYDKYKEKAKELSVGEDMESLKLIITKNLDESFGITMEQARTLQKLNQNKYIEEITKIADNK